MTAATENKTMNATIKLTTHYESDYSGHSADITATIGTKEVRISIEKPVTSPDNAERKDRTFGDWQLTKSNRNAEWIQIVEMTKALTGETPLIDFTKIDELIAEDNKAKAERDEVQRAARKVADEAKALEMFEYAKVLFGDSVLRKITATSSSVTITDLATKARVSIQLWDGWWTCDCTRREYNSFYRRNNTVGEKKRSRKIEKLVEFAKGQMLIAIQKKIDERKKNNAADMIEEAIRTILVPQGFEAPKKYGSDEEKNKAHRTSEDGNTCETVRLSVVDGAVCIVNRTISNVVNEVL